jgi:hypothetical protein
LRKERSDEKPPTFSFFMEEFKTKNKEIDGKSRKNIDSF